MPGPAPTLPPGMTRSDVNDRAPTYAGSLDAAETPKCQRAIPPWCEQVPFLLLLKL
jgi:hypothetical protein